MKKISLLCLAIVFISVYLLFNVYDPKIQPIKLVPIILPPPPPSPPPPPPPIPSSAGIEECAFPPLFYPQSLPNKGLICIVIRTYQGHFEMKNDNYTTVKRLISCLEQMEYPYWTALFLPTDKDPIKNFSKIIEDRDPIYHQKYILLEGHLQSYENFEFGYNRTDWAITQCPSETQWLLVTNGDNEYSPKTFSFLDNNVDGYGFDFYTRWTWTSFWSYHKKYQEENQTFPNSMDECSLQNVKSCAHNHLAAYTSDVGSVIWKYSRWKAENITYSKFSPSCCQDGMVAELLQYNGWFLKVLPFCFFSHSPNNWEKCRHIRREQNG